jgi:hypothetical protein
VSTFAGLHNDVAEAHNDNDKRFAAPLQPFSVLSSRFIFGEAFARNKSTDA